MKDLTPYLLAEVDSDLLSTVLAFLFPDGGKEIFQMETTRKRILPTYPSRTGGGSIHRDIRHRQGSHPFFIHSTAYPTASS